MGASIPEKIEIDEREFWDIQQKASSIHLLGKRNIYFSRT